MAQIQKNTSIQRAFTVAIKRLYAPRLVNNFLFRLFKTCRKEIDHRVSTKELHPDTVNYIKKYD